MTPTPFRMTDDDMTGGDSKVKAAIAPLQDALNVTLNDVVSIMTGGIGNDNLADEIKTLQLDTNVDEFPFKFVTKVVKPRFVSVVIQPKDPDHPNTTPRVMQGFTVTDSGLVSIPHITGLLAANKYTLTFLIRA